MIRKVINWFRPQDTDLRTPEQLYGNALNMASNALTWEQLFGSKHPRQIYGNGKRYMTLSAVYCALNHYIGHTSTLPRFMQKVNLHSQKPEREVSVTEHPSSRIWSHRANSTTSSNDLIKQMCYDLLMDGNFYALRERDAQGRTTKVHHISTSRLPRGSIRKAEGDEKVTLPNGRMVRATRGELLYHIMAGYTTNDEKTMIVRREDVVHMRGNIPDEDYYRACGIIENAMRTMSLYDAAEQMGEEFYRSGYNNQMFLGTPHKLDPKVKKELENTINQADGTMTFDQIIKTRILEHDLKPLHVGMPLSQIAFIETRAFSVEDIGRWFNIPPGILHSLMGRTSSTEDYEKLMMLWIQNGLSTFLGNLTQEVRTEFLGVTSQPVYEFGFRMHYLYRTVANEFSQALRNLFEIGAVDRAQAADLYGIQLDPTDPNNNLRFVPANLVTIEHSKSLEQKAKKSLDQMDEELATARQSREQSKASHDQLMKHGPSVLPGQPGGDDSEESGQESGQESEKGSPKDPGRDRSDKRLRGTPPSDQLDSLLDSVSQLTSALLEAHNELKTRTPPVALKAFHNVLKGMHEYELRVLQQKGKSRGDNWAQAMREWYPDFQNKLTEVLTPWKDVLSTFQESKENVSDPATVAGAWVSLSMECIENTQETEEAENKLRQDFEESFNFLIEELNNE